MIRAGQATQEEQEKAFILDRRKWPCWPFLPMKKYTKAGGWPDLGFLYADFATDQDGVMLFRENMDHFITMTSEERESVEIVQFKTIDELITAGWRID